MDDQPDMTAPVANLPDRFVFADPQGGTREVAKNLLSPAMQAHFEQQYQATQPGATAPVPPTADAVNFFNAPNPGDIQPLVPPTPAVTPPVTPTQLPSNGASGTFETPPAAPAAATTPAKAKANAADFNIGYTPPAIPGMPFGMTPMSLHGADTALESEKKTAGQIGVIESDQAKKEAAAYQEQQVQEKKFADDKKIRDQAYQDSMSSQTKELNTDMEEARKPINANRMWQNRTTGQKIGASLAIMLGAIGSGIRGQTNNPAMDVIHNAIENDIDEQKTNLASAKERVGQRFNLLGQMRDKYHDDETAADAARMAMYENTKTRLMETAKNSGSMLAIKNAAIAGAQLDEKIAGYKMNVDAYMNSRAQQAASMRGLYVPEAGGFARSESEGKEARDSIATYTDLDTKLGQLIDLRKSVAGQPFPTEKKAQAQALANDLQVSLIKNMGVRVSDTVIKKINAMVTSNPSEIGHIAAALEQTRKSIRNSLNTKLRSSVEGSAGYMPWMEAKTPAGK